MCAFESTPLPLHGEIIMTHDEELLKQSLETRQPILFLGAGFSLGAFSGDHEPLMLASNLSKNYIKM